MRPREVFVAGLGAHLPAVVPAAEAVAAGHWTAEQAERTGALGAAVAGDTPAPEMALSAARQALRRSGTEPGELGALLYADVYHAGPDGWLPHSHLQRQLGCGHAFAAGIRQGCNGLFGALELAAVHLQADARHPAALVVAADNFTSPLLDRWQCLHPEQVLADGASAAVLRRGAGFARLASISSTTVVELEELHRGGEPLHPAGVLRGRALDYAARFRAFARTAAPGLGLALVKARTELLDRVLDEADIGAADLARVVCNHGSRASVEDALLSTLDVPLERSNWDFGRRIGHVGASDQLLSLEDLAGRDDLVAGEHVLLYGMGPGLSLAAAVLEIVDTPPWRR
ncbi:ketoacyl-ACP synthase III family protein [Saccharopolyspora rosea]|uniref:Ketoacyl-ACP synthase III family protein n=1 Tax=Saccharopolyspora rosea TaxID=524884 RepID=A0ABW3FVR0_9PSEU|nr:ketoacyl-ACP synthase III family protein [Saccharopolyspora rosea]